MAPPLPALCSSAPLAVSRRRIRLRTPKLLAPILKLRDLSAPTVLSPSPLMRPGMLVALGFPDMASPMELF